VVWYVRIGKGPRTRIPGNFGSCEFKAAYHAAIAGGETPKAAKSSSGSLAWLIARYRESASWTKLSAATRGQRENIFVHILKTAGNAPFAKITRKVIVEGRDRRRDTPAQANNFLKAMRGLFQWALEAEHINVDPTDGVRGFPSKTDGFHTWTEEEIVRFETRWPIGTRERLALAVLLYTGLRRGDAAAIGHQHIRDGIITLRTEKTGVQIVIPVLPELSKIIAASRTGDLALIATDSGRPMTKESFGNWFKGACKAAGVPGSAHGLRKAGATRAANNGATVAQLEAIYGWSGGKMASLYTRYADRVRLAREAMHKLSIDETKNIYSRTLNPGAGAVEKNHNKSKT
jgi:integrase